MLRISEQNLADQARAIRNNNWLSDVELEEIKGQVSRLGNGEYGENREREKTSTDDEIQQDQEPSEYEPVREESERGEHSFHVIMEGKLTDSSEIFSTISYWPWNKTKENN